MTLIASAAVCMGGFIVADIFLFIIGPNVYGCFVLDDCFCYAILSSFTIIAVEERNEP